MKKVWLVNPYGPIEGENWRDYSFNQFGKYLSANGYYVIWWTSNFAHHFKEYRCESWSDIVVNDNYVIRLVPTSSYKKNNSLGRLKKDIIFGKEAKRQFIKENRPDLIIEYLNPLTMGSPTFSYAKANDIPVIVDQMDVWPEFIEKQAPAYLRLLMHYIFTPVYLRRKSIYKNAKGYMALGKHYLQFAKQIVESNFEKPSALVYNGINIVEFRLLMSGVAPKKLSRIEKKNDDIWFVFAGTFGPSYDVKNIIKCAQRAQANNLSIKFIFAGSGPLMDDVKEAELKLNNFIYLGSLLPQQLAPVYAKCDIGLATYSAGSNVDMPDKFYDYTAAGLAVINSLTGEISEYIKEKSVGINYKGGNEESLYEAILIMSKSIATLNEMKNRSRQLGIFFDSQEQNKKLLKLIRTVLG